MVLAELGGRITAAMRSMTAHTVIDEEAVDVMLKEIASVRPPPHPGGPQVGHMRCPQVGTRSHTHHDLKSASKRPIMVSNG